MRHKKKGRSLNRTRSHRSWLLSNLITSLFHHERIRTTTAKAKEARPLAEKLITFAKRGDLHARRRVLKVVRDKDVVAKLFTSLSDRFKDRPGGYTRIVRMGYRNGDNASMAMFELMPEEVAKKSGGKKRRSRRPKKKAEAAEQPPVEQAVAEGAAAVAAAGEDAQAAGEQAPAEASAAEQEPSAGEPEPSGGEPQEGEQKKED